MIFPKPIAGKIARGEVTLAIRPANSNYPKPGDRRCVKASRKGDIACHIIIAETVEMIASEITFKQARACGYRTTDDWRASWVRWRDQKWIDTREITEDNGTVDVDRWMTDTDLLPRFESRHAHKPVAVMGFALAVDTPRYLADQRVSHFNEDGQYTASRHRAIDELEVIDEMTAARYAKQAAEQRASFKRDLEIGRQEQRNSRRDRLFNTAA